MERSYKEQIAKDWNIPIEQIEQVHTPYELDKVQRKLVMPYLSDEGDALELRNMQEDAVRDMTDLEIYQDFVDEMTTFEGTAREELVWAVTGLNSEAGEVAGEVEKMLRKNEPIETREDAVFDEVSDCLFYCCAVLSALGRTADECIEHNIDKLRKRHG